MIIKSLIIIIEILVTYLLQTSVLTHLRLAGVVPDVLMILTISLAFIVGKKTGMLVGFTCGFLLDCTFGTLIGIYSLIYLFLGYLAGFANRIYSNDDYTLPLFLIGGAEFIYEFIYFCFFYLLKGDIDIGYYSVRHMFPRVIYTVMVSILFYRLLNLNFGLFRFIDEKKNQKNVRTHDFMGYDALDRR